jgi:hypothetical protein
MKWKPDILVSFFFNETRNNDHILGFITQLLHRITQFKVIFLEKTIDITIYDIS